MTIKKIRESQDTKSAIKLEPMVNPETGKSSSRHTAFSEVGWGHTTLAYYNSIKGLDSDTMKTIMDEAMQYAKAAERDEDAASVPETIDLDDERANLVEGMDPSDSDEEY